MYDTLSHAHITQQKVGTCVCVCVCLCPARFYVCYVRNSVYEGVWVCFPSGMYV